MKERAGKERAGKERAGKERAGRELGRRAGKERAGKERAGKERAGKERDSKNKKGCIGEFIMQMGTYYSCTLSSSDAAVKERGEEEYWTRRSES